MNWENSKAITALKRDFLKLFFKSNQHFYLTGGSALGIFYLQHRKSYDLDFFTPENVDWHILNNIVLDISKKISAECKSISASPQFHRFELFRGQEHEILDFVVELVPQIDIEKNSFGDIRVDTLREIGINKICTLINRCELKDIIDLYFLSKKNFNILENFTEAAKKEGGLDPAMISYLLSQVSIENISEYLIEPVDKDSLKAFIKNLQMMMASLAFPDKKE